MKRRRTISSPVFERVLLQPHLFQTITAYQHGLYCDLAVLYRDWECTQRVNDSVFFVLDNDFVFLDPVSLQKLHTPVENRRFLIHQTILNNNDTLFYRWLSCAGRDWVNQDTMLCAAHHGNLDLVRYLHERVDVTCTTEALELAAASGFTSVVKYLHTHLVGPCSWRVIYKAAEYGNLEIVQWLSSCGQCRQFTKCAMDYAAGHGHLPVVQYLQQDVHTCSADALEFAAANGHTAIVRFLQSKANVEDEKVFMKAVNAPPGNHDLPTVEDSLDFLLDTMEHVKWIPSA